MTKFEFAHEDIAKFLESTADFEPVPADPKVKNLNVIMAASIILRVYDEMKRRTDDDVSEAFEALRDAVGEFNGDKTKEASKIVLRKLSECSPKLMPVDLMSVRVLVLTLLDAGALSAPVGTNEETLKEEVNTIRTVVVSMATSMAQKFKAKDKEQPESN